MLNPVRAVALLVAATFALAHAETGSVSPLPACHLQVIPDYTAVVIYRAVLRLSPACPAGTVLRVRKSSTLNVVRKGAPYQPLDPPTGAWNLSRTSTTVPRDKLWTVSTWRWEAYDPAQNRWRGAEVLHAAP